MVFSLRVPRKSKFSGCGKLLRYILPATTAPKFGGGTRDCKRSGPGPAMYFRGGSGRRDNCYWESGAAFARV